MREREREEFETGMRKRKRALRVLHPGSDPLGIPLQFRPIIKSEN